MIPYFCTKGNIKIGEAQFTLIPNPVAGKHSRQVYRGIANHLLQIYIGMPFPVAAQTDGLLYGDLQRIKYGTFLSQLVPVFEIGIIGKQIIMAGKF